MKKVVVYLAVGLSVFLLCGCAMKSDTAEVSSIKYFELTKKDDLLYAAKKIFATKDPYVYMVDSYRERVEVSYITTFFNEIRHTDYLLQVEEDSCGVLARLEIKESEGVEKRNEHNLSLSEHNDFWEQIATALDRIEQNTTEESNLSDKCSIKSEFEKGVIRDEINSTGELDAAI